MIDDYVQELEDLLAPHMNVLESNEQAHRLDAAIKLLFARYALDAIHDSEIGREADKIANEAVCTD